MPTLLFAGAESGAIGASRGGSSNSVAAAPADRLLFGGGSGGSGGNLSETGDSSSSLSQLAAAMPNYAGKQQQQQQQRRPNRPRLGPFSRSSTVGVASGSLQDLKQSQQQQQSIRSQLGQLRRQPTATSAPTTQQLSADVGSNNNIGELLSRPTSARFNDAAFGGSKRRNLAPNSRNLNQPTQQNSIVSSQQHHQGANYHPQLNFQPQVQHQPVVAFSKAPNNTDSSSSALNDQTGSDQCNEQEHEDRPSCVQIMKKLFFSLVLGAVIAICWVMIIHTLKWVAIRGNEFEMLNLQQQQQQQQQTYHHHRSAQLQSADASKVAEIVAGEMSSTAAAAAAAATAISPKQPKIIDAPPSYSEAKISAQPIVDLTASNLRAQVNRMDVTQSAEAQTEPKKGIVSPTTTNGRQARQLTENGDDQDDDSNSSSSSSSSMSASANDDQRGPKVFAAPAITSQAGEELSAHRKRVTHLNSIASGRQQQHQTRRPQFAVATMPKNSAQQQQTRSSNGNNDNDNMANSRPPMVMLDFGANYNEESALKSELAINSNAMIGASVASELRPSEGGSNEAWIPSQVESQPAAQSIESNSIERNAQVAGLVFKAPFFTSWFVSIWNILFMPVFTLISSCCFRNEDSTTKKLLVESISQFMDNGLTTLQFLGRCAFFSVLWIGTIFGIVYSLSNIDATVVMALFACSAALVYLLSWVLLHQQFVGVRIVAVIICTTGIALLAYMDNSRTLGSVLIVTGSALCSAVYKVIYQRMFGFWSIAQMSLFFTLIGLFNAFIMWPVALLLYFLGVELIVWRYIPWMHLTAAGALHLTANVVAYFGPICSYDVFLTMGLLFAIILSAVIDVTFYKIVFAGMKLAGVLLLMIGFLVCLLPENWNEFLYDLVNERFVRWKKQRSLKKSRNKVQDLSTGQMSRLRTPSGRVK